MGAWCGSGNFDANLSTAVTTTDVIIIRVRGGYRLPPAICANVAVPVRRSKFEDLEEDPVQAARARIKRQHRISMIEVGRELRASRERALLVNRLLAFRLERPPENRIMERLSPCPRAPPMMGPPRAAR